jgi:hypothetical protein
MLRSDGDLADRGILSGLGQTRNSNHQADRVCFTLDSRHSKSNIMRIDAFIEGRFRVIRVQRPKPLIPSTG